MTTIGKNLCPGEAYFPTRRDNLLQEYSVLAGNVCYGEKLNREGT